MKQGRRGKIKKEQAKVIRRSKDSDEKENKTFTSLINDLKFSDEIDELEFDEILDDILSENEIFDLPNNIYNHYKQMLKNSIKINHKS